ncbi:putative ATPase/DNA-binding winged helix-turn-helix (wHTH) protein [Bradyrhizobium sp. JR7.2]
MIDRKNPKADQEILFGPFRLSGSRRVLEKEGVPIEVGVRAFEILAVLVEHAGKVVGKKDLIAQVWPGVTIDEVNLRVQVAMLRKALGEGDAGARYVATIPGQGYCFVAPISRLGPLQADATHNPASFIARKLPPRLTRMIGRDEVVHEISGQLSERRFVTMVGPGGIGKTTVAVSVAHALFEEFAGAVCFADLGPLNEPSLVASAIASALRLGVRFTDPTKGLVNFLRDKRVLLIFDSCEHVIGTAAAIAEEIFVSAPQVHILVTSRESLRVEGEYVYSLAALDSPPGDADLTAARALAFPAVQLFVERAAVGRQYFQLHDADASIVGDICRRLDGIALAIELAAGRVDAYGIRETAALLNDRLNLLGEGKRTALARHQTLSATLDWSYDLLSESERLILRRLSVFAGNFTLEAARSIAVGIDLDDAQVVTGIASLIGKSLLATDGDNKAARYRLLDTTRAYGLGKLAGSGELDYIKRRHASYYKRIFERIDHTSSGVEGFSTYAEHLDNVRAGLEWCFSDPGDIRVGIALAAATVRLFLEMSLLTECRRWAERSITAFDESDRGSAREMELRSALGLSLMFATGNSDEARGALLRGLELAEELGDLRNQLRLLEKLHVFHQRIGDCHEAFTLAQQSEDVAASLGDSSSVAIANWTLGFSHYFAGDCKSAQTNWGAPMPKGDSSRSYGTNVAFDRDIQARTRCGLGSVLWVRGFPDQAMRIGRDIIKEGATLRDPSTFCICLIFTSFTSLRIGNQTDAADMIGRLLAHARKHSLGPYEAIGIGLRGTLLINRGQAEEGVGMVRDAIETLHVGRYELHNPAFLAASAEGLRMLGQYEEAFRQIDEAIARIERNGQLLFLPEFLRIKGTIVMAARQADLSQAEALYLRALTVAGGQSALAWELRAATSAARLRAIQHRIEDARAILAPIYSRFTEGFETADLKDCKAVLDRLG